MVLNAGLQSEGEGEITHTSQFRRLDFKQTHMSKKKVKVWYFEVADSSNGTYMDKNIKLTVLWIKTTCLKLNLNLWKNINK